MTGWPSLALASWLAVGAWSPRQAATEPGWEALPCPNVATVTCLAGEREGALLAGTGAGLYRSDDGGASWGLRSPVDWRVLSVLETQDGALLLGTYRHGIQRSADGGRSWATVGFENNVYVDALAQDGQGRVFAAVAHAVGSEPGGIFRSPDDGRTWSASGLQGRHAYSLSLYATGELYAGTDQGAFRSLDGGASWSPLEGLASEAPLSDVVRCKDTLYASFAEPRHRAPGAGARISTDDGATWTALQGLPAQTSLHALVVVGDAVFAAAGDPLGRGAGGVHVSRAGGPWGPAGLDDQWVVSLVAGADGALYAGSEGSGMFTSRDGAATWVARSAGIRDWSDAALAFDGSGQLFALTLRALLHFDEARAAWIAEQLPESAAPPTPWNFLSWSGGGLVLPGMGAVFFSQDAGRSWIRSAVPQTTGSPLALHAGEGGELFVVFPGEGVFVLADPDEEWARVDAPADTLGVFVSPAGTLFALGARSLQRAASSGSWEPVGPADRRSFALQSCGDTLYLASPPEGVLASTDDGRTWQPVSQELRAAAQQPGYLGVHSLLPLADGGLLAATFSDGVFLLDREGQWSDVTQGLPTRSVGDMASGPDGRVYVHTVTGLFRRTP